MSLPKADIIRRAASGRSKRFSQIFVEIDKLYKKHKKKRSTQFILGVALQVYYLRDCRGSGEFMETVCLAPKRTAVIVQTSMVLLEKIKKTTLERNVRAYIEAKANHKSTH